MQNDLTRPIIGIENRSAQEVFDIMCDRFRHLSATVPAGDGELVERLRYRVENPSAWTEGFDQDASDLMAFAASRLSQGTGERDAQVLRLTEENEALTQNAESLLEIIDMRKARIKALEEALAYSVRGLDMIHNGLIDPTGGDDR